MGIPINKSIQDWTAVAQNAIVKSSEYSLVTKHNAILHLQAALDTATAHTGTKFIIQMSNSVSGNEDWQDLTEFVGLIGTAATDLIEDNPLAASSTAIALTGHALTALSKWLFIEDGTLVNSEFVKESSQTTNEIVVLDETTNVHAVGTAIFNIALTQSISIPFAANRVRLVVDNSYDADGSTLNYKLGVSSISGV